MKGTAFQYGRPVFTVATRSRPKAFAKAKAVAHDKGVKGDFSLILYHGPTPMINDLDAFIAELQRAGNFVDHVTGQPEALPTSGGARPKAARRAGEALSGDAR